MAHGAFHAVGGMRAGFPLVIKPLVAGGTGIPGWNQPMHHMLGLILLSHGRLEGNSRNEKNEQDETEYAGTETIHGQTPEYGNQVCGSAMTAISDPHHVPPECNLRASDTTSTCVRAIPAGPTKVQKCRGRFRRLCEVHEWVPAIIAAPSWVPVRIAAKMSMGQWARISGESRRMRR